MPLSINWKENDDSFSIDKKPVKQLKFRPILDYLVSKEKLEKPGLERVLKAFGRSNPLECMSSQVKSSQFILQQSKVKHSNTT